MLKKICFVIFISIFLIVNVFAQVYESKFCGTSVIDLNAITALVGEKLKPSITLPNQYIKVLIIFAEFANDTRSFSDWQYGQLPSYSNKLLSETIQSNYKPLSISDYWDKMSLGKCDIIGDVFPSIIRINSVSYYNLHDKYYQDCNRDVLTIVDEF